MSSGMNRTQAEEYAKTMTYKQAISNIRTGKGIVYRKATMIKLNELAEIADRLVMCKDCNLISRQSALAEFKDGRDVYDIMESIEELPSAEPKTGRWVRKEKEINDCDGYRAYYWYECDNCGARPPKDQWGHEWHSDFCPNCGAIMKGGAE